MTPAEVEQELLGFEGLIFTTSIIILEAGVEMEADDIRQTLRVKAWQAVLAYDKSHAARMPKDRYVFMCLVNAKKDILKRPRRYTQSLDVLRSRDVDRRGDNGAEKFDGHYLAVDREDVYREVDDEPVALPSTLDSQERQIVAMRLADPDLTLSQMERALGLSRGERERLMRSIQTKLADWRPTREHVPTPPLPRVVQSAHAPAVSHAA